ncbi:MAG: AfsR/SARP family transcriptional regulator, partial [Solirubrobacteraceae bacterium]
MGFSLIGRIEWAGPGGTGRPAGVLQRRLLAILALEANRTVSDRRLIEALWDDQPPRTARRTLHAHVSRLRRALAATGVDAVVVHREGGYELAVDPEQIDVLAFQALARKATRAMAASAAGGRDGGCGTRADDHAAAALADLDAALRLSEGEPLAGCQGTPAFDAEIARLRELRVSVTELRVEALQALGAHDQTIAELERLTVAYPLRERLWQLLMLALYASGRQADALAAFARARAHLVKELGLEPGPELRRLQSAVLAQDPALAGASPNGRSA